jgi:septum formation protein
MKKGDMPAEIITLASASPQRRALLRQIGLDPLVHPAAIDESAYLSDASTIPHAIRALARAKALTAKDDGASGFIIAGDTVILHDGAVFGKPADEDEAARTLRTLSGNTHYVFGGVAVVNKDGKVFDAYDETAVAFRELDEKEIEWYVRSGEPFGRAGAYAIQGKGALLVKWLHGSYSNVVGLPLAVCAALLRSAGYPLYS